MNLPEILSDLQQSERILQNFQQESTLTPLQKLFDMSQIIPQLIITRVTVRSEKSTMEEFGQMETIKVIGNMRAQLLIKVQIGLYFITIQPMTLQLDKLIQMTQNLKITLCV